MFLDTLAFYDFTQSPFASIPFSQDCSKSVSIPKRDGHDTDTNSKMSKLSASRMLRAGRGSRGARRRCHTSVNPRAGELTL